MEAVADQKRATTTTTSGGQAALITQLQQARIGDVGGVMVVDIELTGGNVILPSLGQLAYKGACGCSRDVSSDGSLYQSNTSLINQIILLALLTRLPLLSLLSLLALRIIHT
jgi:hypothetical protein